MRIYSGRLSGAPDHHQFCSVGIDSVWPHPPFHLLLAQPLDLLILSLRIIMFAPRINAIGRPAANRVARCLQTTRIDSIPKNQIKRQIQQQRPHSTSPLFSRPPQCLHRLRQEALRNRIPRQRRYQSGSPRGGAKALFLAYPYSVTAAAFLYLSPS